MEFIFSNLTAIAATICVFLLAFLYHLLYYKPNTNAAGKKRKSPPQAAGAWPIIGHLHLITRSDQLLPVTLGKLADKYGPVFTIKFGVQQALVVSSPEVAKECFTLNDKVFASRPKSLSIELMGYNYAMFGMAPYGQYWRQLRKIVVQELLSQRRLEILERIRVFEVNSSIRDIYEAACGNDKEKAAAERVVKIEMKEWLGKLLLNVIVRNIWGKRFSDDDEEGIRFGGVVRKFFELIGAFVVSDAIPYLRWLDLGGYEKAMKMTFKELDDIFDGWLQQHKRRDLGAQIKGEQKAFIDVMVSALEGASAEDFPGFDPDTIIKATCQEILTAALDPSAATLTWILSLLLNNPEVLKHAQNELDIQVGRERLVEELDMKKLVYLQAIVKETLRLHPAGPVPHESMEDCVVAGYNIPKGTRLLVNYWKIHHDPHIWSDPHEFRPERFLTDKKEIDVKGQHFELIPFGTGRRICPGISFALQTVQLTLARLIQGFEIAKPSTEPIDMSAIFGLSSVKATPLEVLLTPRLPHNLYV